MAEDQDLFILKILSGPHQGAEVSLKEGDYSIGASVDSDIILADAMVADEHFKLRVEGSAVVLIPVAEGVYVGGAPAKNEVVLQNYQFITIGTTHMAIGPADEQWPPLSTADAPALQKESESEDISEGEEDTQLSEEEPQEASMHVQPQPTPAGVFAFLDPVLKPINEFWQSQSVMMRSIYAGALACVLIGLITVTVVFWPSDTNKDFGSAPDTEQLELLSEEVRQKIEELGFEKFLNVKAVERQGVLVYGYVDTIPQKNVIQVALLQLSPLVILRIQSQADLVKSAGDVLARSNLSLKVESGDYGQIVVTGYAYDQSAWGKAKDLLLQDVPGLQKIKDDVFTGAEVVQEADKILMKAQLAQSIQILPQARFVVAKGAITAQEDPAWIRAKSQIRQILKGAVPLQDRVYLAAAIDAEKLYFDNEIESINVSDPAWISLSSGDQYFVGGILPTGYTIETIDRESITLRKGSTIILVKLKNL